MNKKTSKKSSVETRRYFVDEAGDGNLFNKNGRLRFGEEGCSHYFIPGILDIPDQSALRKNWTRLENNCLTPPISKEGSG